MLADYRTKAINHQTQVYRLKTAKYKCILCWYSGGLLTILGFYFLHISSHCKVVLLKDGKIYLVEEETLCFNMHFWGLKNIDFKNYFISAVLPCYKDLDCIVPSETGYRALFRG